MTVRMPVFRNKIVFNLFLHLVYLLASALCLGSGFLRLSGTTLPRRASVLGVTDKYLGVIIFPTRINVLFFPVVTMAPCLPWLLLKARVFIRLMLSEHFYMAIR